MGSTPNLSQSENRIENIKKLSQIRNLRAKEVLMVGKPKLISEEEHSSRATDNFKYQLIINNTIWK